MSNGDESHPLFIHAIVLFLVAVLLVVMGVIGAVQVAKAEGTSLSLKDIADADAKTKAATTTAKSAAGSAPGGVSDAVRKAQEAQKLAAQAKAAAAKGKAFILPILMILWGAATGAAGFFLLQKANWARFAGIGLVAGTLLYYTWLMSAANASPAIAFQVWRPLMLTAVAGLCGKFLWDMAMEKLPATA